MNEINFIDVFKDEVKVGRLTLTSESLCAFEYETEYTIFGQSISPYFLPLKTGLTVAKRIPFEGEFGVFNDSLPDGWGAVIRNRYLMSIGQAPEQLTVLQRLAYVGNHGRGALEYKPNLNYAKPHEEIDLQLLAKEIEKIQADETYTGDAIETLFALGGTTGGEHPKLFVQKEGKEWLVKFAAAGDPPGVGDIEYHYALLAGKCGIRMPETRLFDGKYFGVERFDRSPEGKIHTISMAALLNADYRFPTLDYTVMLHACHNLTKSMEDIYTLFRQMVFNIAIKNQDDHAKDFSFQFIDNKWKLAPAYDLLPSAGFGGFHTSTVNNNNRPEKSDILIVAEENGIERQHAKLIMEEIYDIVNENRLINY